MLYTALHFKDIRKCDRTSGLLTLEQIAATQMLHYVDWIQTMMQTTFKFFPCPCCLLPIWIQTIPNPSIFARPPPRNTVCWMSFQSQWKITPAPAKKKGSDKKWLLSRNCQPLIWIAPWHAELYGCIMSDLDELFFLCNPVLIDHSYVPFPLSFEITKISSHWKEVFPKKLWPRRGVASPAGRSSIPWPVRKKRWRVVPVIHMGVS